MSVLRLLASRVLLSALTLFLVSILIFLILEALPGDVATRILGRDATAKALEVLRSQLHLDQPALVRYFHWLGDFLRGDLGVSIATGRPIADVLGPRIVNTLLLSLFAFAIYLALALIPAIIQATNRGKAVDNVISVITLLLLSLPDFLLATILLFLFAVAVPILPALATISEASTWQETLRAMVLPAVTLAIMMAVYAIRVLRDSLIEVLGSDYVRLAELKGLRPRAVLLRHALPNAIVPALNVTALNLGFLIGGVVIVERVFSYPGFGTLLIDALQLRDIPLIKATVMISAAVYVTANLVADILAVLLQPRLRTRR
ncbi:ABC transporter permease [Mesorhizobium sp. VK23B]|uniref:ABC transporter permease n=1 Tax=Mesorhizobium dulcispinae TaxID=3072316 RepID=A0ABU4XBY0_9HYPH|nr:MULTISPECIES: ABC transporter permease [unclassified Mesorhizobium]MDX8465665.1 ABC transporter permease [Mesorhizobium sp. VK23B]MDX8471533.1 ABC transporter permease [Mesorhizobium sp. VK23A]